MYKKIELREGVKMLPHIWTIILSKKNNVFVEPFTLRELRYRCLFTRIGEEKLIAYFHLGRSEQFNDISPLPSNIYLYGACGQISVYQIRSFGFIRKMTEREMSWFTNSIKSRLNGEKTGDDLLSPPSSDERIKAMEALKRGSFYRFEPSEYAYSTYERG